MVKLTLEPILSEKVNLFPTKEIYSVFHQMLSNTILLAEEMFEDCGIYCCYLNI